MGRFSHPGWFHSRGRQSSMIHVSHFLNTWWHHSCEWTWLSRTHCLGIKFNTSPLARTCMTTQSVVYCIRACVFGRYLSEHIPSMTILPIRVDIALLRNNIVLPDVEIKAQDRWESFMVNNYVVIISSRWPKMRLVFELYSRLLRANLSHVDRQSVVLSHWGILGSELTATTSSRSTHHQWAFEPN